MRYPFSARAPARHNRVRLHAPAASTLPPFIAWLRRLRRSAWLLIAVCMLVRIGTAIVQETPGGPGDAVAAAEQPR
ncbi:hypothetical protein [uncultured Sphingomonas sp.]|uniref:hypothetical protein n=1 Tax=uncultured Sphingomonas sp. TaxID=158754 RepID=UPI0025F5D13B|nr:hypothetical protein [uncultured Sphingomonas sp.]